MGSNKKQQKRNMEKELKIILNSIDYDVRNYSLDFEPNEEINISVQKELLQMRKTKDY